TQHQQQSIVGNAGNIHSSSSSSILYAISQIFSTNTSSSSTTTTTTTNTAAKPHMPNSLSLYNNNHLSTSSSLVTFSTTDSPISATTIENEKKITDRRITPNHIFASTNSFFNFTPSKPKTNKNLATNHQTSITARTSSSSTSSSTDEALIQLTQQLQNVNKLFNDEPISIFNYSSLPSETSIDKQQQAVHDNINLLASMATALTSIVTELACQQSVTSTSLLFKY
ncbi:unnamed protein product, partial [Rotaria sp. Silwood2]